VAEKVKGIVVVGWTFGFKERVGVHLRGEKREGYGDWRRLFMLKVSILLNNGYDGVME
jgi:hypothetical protein